jgi:hypothetical protein
MLRRPVASRGKKFPDVFSWQRKDLLDSPPAMKNIQPLQLILGGCGLAALGTLLPWASYHYEVPAMNINESKSILGISDFWGVLIFLLSGAAIASVYVKLPGKTKLLATCGLAAVGLALLITVIQLFRLLGHTSDVQMPGGSAGTSSSIGIYLTLLGAAAGAYGCFLRWKPIPADPPPAAGPPPPQPPPPPQA